jgi:class I lanthipeptide synthase
MSTIDATARPGRVNVPQAVCSVLEAYTADAANDRPAAGDHVGPAVLARLAAELGEDGRRSSRRALAAWTRSALSGYSAGRRSRGHAGASHGAAAVLTGLRYAAELDPALAPAAARVHQLVAAVTRQPQWRTEQISWIDYDLMIGPAGLIAALACDPQCPPDDLVPTARHLAALCDSDGLDRLRIGHADPALRWNLGQINTGLAHGVAGVVAALRIAATATGATAELAAPLARACHWLRAESFVDSRGVHTWARAGRDGAPPPATAARRQAWCYGTPGIAWSLWDAASLLGDPEICRFATAAMRSFCLAFDEDFYLGADAAEPGGALAVCHGAAGVLAIADAFARHAGLSEAAALGDRLEGYLLDHIDEMASWPLSLHHGSGGVLAVLITRQGGDRGWLRLLGLR